MTNFNQILEKQGFRPDFRPNDELLKELQAEKAKPLTTYRFTKLRKGTAMMLLSEAAKIAKWLNCAIEELCDE